jgi:hypothetical protein
MINLENKEVSISISKDYNILVDYRKHQSVQVVLRNLDKIIPEGIYLLNLSKKQKKDYF